MADRCLRSLVPPQHAHRPQEADPPQVQLPLSTPARREPRPRTLSLGSSREESRVLRSVQACLLECMDLLLIVGTWPSVSSAVQWRTWPRGAKVPSRFQVLLLYLLPQGGSGLGLTPKSPCPPAQASGGCISFLLPHPPCFKHPLPRGFSFGLRERRPSYSSPLGDR